MENMKTKMKTVLGLVLVMLIAPISAHAIVIDDFNANQGFVVGPNGSEFDYVEDFDILGEERDVEATANGGSDDLEVSSNDAGSGTFEINAATSQRWNVTWQWDGWDSDNYLDYTGLGGVDLTDGGLDDRFELWISDSTHPILPPTTALELQVYTSATQWSSYSINFLAPIWAPGEALVLGFDDFVDAGAFGGADFTNVGAIQMSMSSTMGGHDMELDFLQTANSGAGPAPVPEPSTMFLLGSGLIGCAMFGRKKMKKG